MELQCSGYLCGNKTEFNLGEWIITGVLGTKYSKCILEIDTYESCKKPLLTRSQVIQLRDFLSDVIARTYVEHYFDDLED